MLFLLPRKALRSVLPDIEELTDEDLRLLFMKIDADGSGEIDWDEFTGFLLQVSERNARNPWHHSLGLSIFRGTMLFVSGFDKPKRLCLAQGSSPFNPSMSAS